MKYDFSQKYRIKITGTPEEIKDWIKEISNFMDKGSSYSMIKDSVDNLEKLIDAEYFTFMGYHRIYFNKNSLLYVPNVGSKEAQKLHFTVFKKMFDESKKKMDEKYKK